MFSYKRHSASFTLLEGWLFLRERLLSEITLLEYGGSAGTRNRNKCFFVGDANAQSGAVPLCYNQDIHLLQSVTERTENQRVS